MQAIGDLFANNKVLFVAILVVVLAVVAAAVALLSRLVFGGRISTAAGGRARQPRLGVVDAFDLDRQRQLVIVRRDNVEHLLMIGGPNDLLIETAIVRAAPTTATVIPREKEDPVGPTLPPVQAPRSAPIPAFAPPTAPTLPGLPIPSLGDQIGQAATQNESGEPMSVAFPPLRPITDSPPVSAGPNLPRPTPSTPTPPRPGPPPMPPRAPAATPAQAGVPLPKPVFSPAPPRPIGAPAPRPVVTPTRATPAVTAPVRAGEPRRAEEPPRTTTPDAPPALDNQPAAAAAAEPVTPLKIPPPPVKNQRVEPPRIEATAAKLSPPPPNRSASVSAPAIPMVKSLDALESLEEEMAKLLGRPVPPAEKS